MVRDRTAIMTTSTLWLLIITWESTFLWPSNEPDTSLPYYRQERGSCAPWEHPTTQWLTWCLWMWSSIPHWLPPGTLAPRDTPGQLRTHTLELDEWYDYEMQIFLPVSILSLFVSAGLRAYWCTIARQAASTRSTGVKLVWNAPHILSKYTDWICSWMLPTKQNDK